MSARQTIRRWAVRLTVLAGTLVWSLPAAAQVRSFDLTRAASPYNGDHGFEPTDPASFSIKAAPGRYRVTVRLGRPDRATNTTVKAEARRLMLDAISLPAGASVTRTFLVDVRTAAIKPDDALTPIRGVELKERERRARTWDDRLTLEFVGPAPGVTAVTVEPVQAPAVFLLGDSTVTDQWAEPFASWGQMLPAFLDDGVVVANHAESGESMKSFVMAKRLAKVLEAAKPGDWALIQFGHNDQKSDRPLTYVAADSTYRSWLTVFIDEFRRRGVHPVLVTPPERRNWTGTRIRPTLSAYADAVRAVGKVQKVPVIDLNAASIRFYEALGPKRAPLAFAKDGKDPTHHDNYGAWVLARAVADGMARAGLPLARHLRKGLAPFDASRPPAPETFVLAPSGVRSDAKPDGS